MVSPKLAFVAAASVLQGATSLMSARSQSKALEAEADATRQAGVENEKLRKIKTRKIIGRQLAQAGVSGFTGSDLEVLAQTVIEDELQGDINIFNSNVAATGLENEASVVRQGGMFDLINSGFQAGSVFAAGSADLNKFDQVYLPNQPQMGGGHSLFDTSNPFAQDLGKYMRTP